MLQVRLQIVRKPWLLIYPADASSDSTDNTLACLGMKTVKESSKLCMTASSDIVLHGAT